LIRPPLSPKHTRSRAIPSRLHDYPYEAILNTARKEKCDLIAMASHGRRGLSAVVLGSETQKVLTHSTIPVIVYR